MVARAGDKVEREASGSSSGEWWLEKFKPLKFLPLSRGAAPSVSLVGQ